MAASDTQRRTRNQHARTRNIASFYGVAKSNVRITARSYISDRRESSFKRHARVTRAGKRLSLVIPATAIVLNLLSVGAAYGVLVWIFQDGHLQGLLGFRADGAIVTWLPLFLFAVLFGLSMDYHVFIVSRIKELADRGASTEQAVARGIAATAGTVTAAAAVMVAVFAVFATLSTLEIKQMGVGLAVAVLIDATIIRAVLLPATMKLLGRWNWYLPGWLQWLPRIRAERSPGRPLTEIG